MNIYTQRTYIHEHTYIHFYKNAIKRQGGRGVVPALTKATAARRGRGRGVGGEGRGRAMTTGTGLGGARRGRGAADGEGAGNDGHGRGDSNGGVVWRRRRRGGNCER